MTWCFNLALYFMFAGYTVWNDVDKFIIKCVCVQFYTKVIGN